MQFYPFAKFCRLTKQTKHIVQDTNTRAKVNERERERMCGKESK